jgi:AAA ATPase containing von willebrand factor type A (VWA) domain-like protein
MNENNATVMYEKRFFKTIGKIVKKKVELVGNFVSVLQAVKCQIPLVVMMGNKDEAFDIERSLNAMLGAHQNFKSMPEIKLLKSYSKSPNISAGDCVTTSFIHFTNEESEFFNFVVELLNMPLFLENYRQYCSQNQKEARKLLFDVYSEIGQFYKEFEEYAESLEEGIRLPGVGFEIDRHLYSNSKRIIDACKTSDEVDVIRRANGEIGPDCAYVVRVRNGASQAIEIDEALADDLFAAEENLDADDPIFEGDGEDVEDGDEDDCEDGGEEDDDDDAGGSNGSGPGNSSAGGNNTGGKNTGGNNAGGPGKSGGNNTGSNPNGKSGK